MPDLMECYAGVHSPAYQDRHRDRSVRLDWFPCRRSGGADGECRPAGYTQQQVVVGEAMQPVLGQQMVMCIGNVMTNATCVQSSNSPGWHRFGDAVSRCRLGVAVPLGSVQSQSDSLRSDVFWN